MPVSPLIRKEILESGPKEIAGKRLDALPDTPDIRDRFYEPALIPLRKRIGPPARLPAVLDQGQDGACTGFALAAVINLLLQEQEESITVSPWMLYEMARRYDEWPGEDYEGSSLRGALRGWYHNGVCHHESWPQRKTDLANDGMTVAQAQEARSVSLGAYYRLRPDLPDFHAALNECQVLYVSAAIHEGWQSPVKDGNSRYVIQPGSRHLGFHAFAVVGYDCEGFWVQNSWRADWGDKGLALWRYEDWLDNLQDAWVIRLGVCSSHIVGRGSKTPAGAPVEFRRQPAAPTRAEIAGHYVHIDDGAFCNKRPYWSSPQDVTETANHLARRIQDSNKYKHLLIYAHGGLNTSEDCARRTRAMTPVFLANGVYPYSVMYDTGLMETLKDTIWRQGNQFSERAGGVFDLMDPLLERLLSNLGGKMWREMKLNAKEMFDDGKAGANTLEAFLAALQATGIKLHLVGHSLGSVLVGHLLQALIAKLGGDARIATCSLLAPACRVDFFNEVYVPTLGQIDDFAIYNLSDELEQNDTVATVYRKSLLYLVSNAFEDERGTALAGMDRYRAQLDRVQEKIHIASPASDITRSTSHGGFDNDPHTMNHILGRILGHGEPINKSFTQAILDY